jgi:hypothetical protein
MCVLCVRAFCISSVCCVQGVAVQCVPMYGHTRSKCYVALSCSMCANRSTAGMHRWKKKAAPQVRLTAVQSVAGAPSADIGEDFAEIFFAKEAAC